MHGTVSAIPKLLNSNLASYQSVVPFIFFGDRCWGVPGVFECQSLKLGDTLAAAYRAVPTCSARNAKLSRQNCLCILTLRELPQTRFEYEIFRSDVALEALAR